MCDIENQNGIDELFHHGVKGQKWGEKNGPPYPLEGAKKEKAAKRHAENREEKREAKKKKRAAVEKQKAKVRASKKEQKVEAAKKRLEANKKKWLESPSDLYKHRKMYSKEEIDAAMKNFEWEKKLRDFSKDELDKTAAKMQNWVKISGSMIGLYNNAALALNTFTKSELPKMTWPAAPKDDKDKAKKK